MTEHAAPRILCVSPLFPPTVNAESFVAAKWVLALLARGVDVTIVAEPGDAVDRSALWAPLEARTVRVEAPADARPLLSLALGIRYRVGRLYPRWIDAVVRRAQALHREKPFDLVVSRSLPMRGHVAGYWCSRAIGAPWAAVINDPWDLHLFPGRVKRVAFDRQVVSNLWLRQTFRRADAVLGPCERLNAYNRALAGSTRATTVLPHVGWAVPAAPAQGFRLVHAGTLGRESLTGGRPAAGLVSGLAQFLAARPEARDATRLRLVGPKDADAEALAREIELADVVEFTGRVSCEESLREIGSAAVCVLVEAPMEKGIYLPSKVADYVAASKPVLALSPRVGTLADLARERGITRVDVEDAAAVARAIETHYDAWRSGQLAALEPSQALKDMFDASAVADAFLAAVRA